MPHCHTLIRAAIILTQDEQRSIIHDGTLAISHDERGEGYIAALGPASAMGRWQADRVLDYGGHMIMPGLINAHAHCAMTLMRGFADDLPLLQWLEQGIFPLERRLTPELVRLGTMLGHAEMLAHGTTACMDMYLFEDEVFAAAETAGLRLTGGEAVFAFPSAACPGPFEALEKTRQLARRLAGHPRLAAAVNAHSVYTTDAAILRTCRDLALELDLPLHMHLAESSQESALSQEKWGMRPLAWCEKQGLLDARCTFAHMVDLTGEEIALAARRGVAAVHNPSSNMKLASGVAPVPRMLDAGMIVALGTDGPASNNRLSIFTEMARAALLHKCAGNDAAALPAQIALDMATLHGARALGRPELGCLAPGRPADLCALNLARPNLAPMHSPVSQAVYAATGQEVEMTMVAGEVLYERGRFSRFDYPALLAELNQAVRFLTQSCQNT